MVTPPDDQLPTSDEFGAGSLGGGDTTDRFWRAIHGDEGNGPGEKAGDEIGPYKLVAKIGEGGFGTVWVAERREPFRQTVALKLIKLGMDSRAVIARFEQERQALAVMNHPNIAKVLDGGLTANGRPYFAMEYVKGEPINAFCDRRRMSIEARLALFAQACDAIHHAHVKGIVHRDIKPSNVLAYEQDGKEPTLKVIDFGVAKALTQRLTERTIFTETGQMVGTPEYMSPEQADPGAADVDTRSDVYALGVLLYELVTGELPFDPKELRRKAYGEIQRTLREDDPPTPSSRLSTVALKSRERASDFAKTHGIEVSELVRQLRRGLEGISLKAMRKAPAGRYQSAALLAEDVRNYLVGKPLMAARESVGNSIWLSVRHGQLGVTAVATTLGMLIVLSCIYYAVTPPGRPPQIRNSESALGVISALVELESRPDPAVVTDVEARARIEATGLPWKVRDRKTGIVMLLCPPGEFMMGSPENEPGRSDDEAQQQVSITQAFYISETEVTQEQWQTTMGDNPSQYKGASNPVDSVSWGECQRFCSSTGFRLPSEAEWEYACRAGTTGAHAGDVDSMAWYLANSGNSPHPVKGKRANPWGLYDMHGNVWEWCADWYLARAPSTQAPATVGNGKRVLRGGGWYGDDLRCRSASRPAIDPGYTYAHSGFRVARTPG